MPIAQVFATVFLHERFTILDAIAATMMVTGTILAVVFGSEGSHQGFLTVENIEQLWSRPAAIVGFVIFGCILVCGITYVVLLDKGVAAGTIEKSQKRFRFSVFVRCITAGVFSGFVGMFSKSIVSIFASASGGSDLNVTLATWEPYVFILLLLVCLLFQITFLNSALKRFDATEAVPIYQSMVVVWYVKKM
jgi:drug/metabolite transporter (DMT)-like permease